MQRWAPPERAALLAFAHGSDHAPSRGFAFLRGYHGSVHRFTIRRVNASVGTHDQRREAYPRAQTCFNVLLLPAYTDVTEMERRLRAVLQDGAGRFDEGAVANP